MHKLLDRRTHNDSPTRVLRPGTQSVLMFVASVACIDFVRFRRRVIISLVILKTLHSVRFFLVLKIVGPEIYTCLQDDDSASQMVNIYLNTY